MREYSGLGSLVNNIPYALMVALGAAAIAVGLQGSPWQEWTWVAGGVYAAYGVIGALWIMVFVCPYCHFYGSWSCPCGYGVVSELLRSKQEQECFAAKFKRHIPVIVPLWIIPAAAGVFLAVKNFTWLLVGIVVVFALDAFVLLPLVSAKHGCRECPQRDDCPWMRK